MWIGLPLGWLPPAGNNDAGPILGLTRLRFHGGREVHRVMDAIGVAWHRLVEMIASVQKDLRRRS